MKKSAKPKLNGRHSTAATNEAPITIPVLGPEVMRQSRRSRFNPIRNVTPESLSTALDSFDAGDLRTAALLWQKIAERDDTICTVKPKRELATAHRQWQVITTEDTPEAAAEKAVLEWFWNHITAENAYDRNDSGGFTKFVQQVMEAVSYRYASHHIKWQPRTEEQIDLGNGKQIPALTALFEYVPLQFFENQTGRLRFIKDGMSITGETMQPGEWVTTVGPGIMIAASIGYIFKRLSYHDWIAYSEKFGTPGVFGKTNAAKGTEAGNAMKAAVEAFGQDFACVAYGDDGSSKIELITPQGGGGAQNIPMPALIDRIDRKITSMFRGADLSTMSSGADSQGRGASVQEGETEIFDRADAAMVSETLNRIDRLVLQYQLGTRSPRAYTQIVLPESKDLAFTLTAIEKLVDRGLPVAQSDVREIFALTQPKEGEALLSRSAAPAGAGFGSGFEPAFNSKDPRAIAVNSLMTKARALLGSSLAQDLQPLRKALQEVLEGPDAGLPQRLATFKKAMPGIVRQVFRNDKAATAFEQTLTASFFSGLTEPQNA